MTMIAFIGLGNMGLPMAANLARAGHQVVGFDYSDAAMEKARAASVLPAQNGASAARAAEVVITMLPAGKHLVDAYSGAGGFSPRPSRELCSSTARR
jgi:3-hydroxyisobutyrate dehydrogenase